MENNILDAAVAANESMNPLNMDVATGILDKATEVVPAEQTEQLNNLSQAVAADNTQSFDINNLTPEQLAMLRPRKPIQQVRNYTKIRRNDLCPCGSGKKYKNCCLSSGKYEGYHNAGEEYNPSNVESA